MNKRKIDLLSTFFVWFVDGKANLLSIWADFLRKHTVATKRIRLSRLEVQISWQNLGTRTLLMLHLSYEWAPWARSTGGTQARHGYRAAYREILRKLPQSGKCVIFVCALYGTGEALIGGCKNTPTGCGRHVFEISTSGCVFDCSQNMLISGRGNFLYV